MKTPKRTKTESSKDLAASSSCLSSPIGTEDQPGLATPSRKRARVDDAVATLKPRHVKILPHQKVYDKATMDLLALLQAEVLPSDAVSVVKQLLEARPDCNAFTKDGKSLLELSIRHRREDIATSLLEHGAYSNFVSLVEHWSMMMLAVSFGEVNIVKKLLEYNACLSHLDREGNSVFDINAQQLDMNVGSQLFGLLCEFAQERRLQIMANTNVFKDYQHAVPNQLDEMIFEAINTIDDETLVDRLVLLFKLGADVNCTKDGASPLLHCIYRGREAGVKVCLQHGADVDFIYTPTGNTAIMAATQRDQLSIVVELLKYHPNLALVNNKGNDVFQIAAFKNANVWQLLKALKPDDIIVKPEDLIFV